MTFRPDQLTVKAQEAVQRAERDAEERAHQQFIPLHLLAALLDEQQGVVRPLLQKIGANVDQLRPMIDSELARLPKVSGPGFKSPRRPP